jgi:hypothetical protein
MYVPIGYHKQNDKWNTFFVIVSSLTHEDPEKKDLTFVLFSSFFFHSFFYSIILSIIYFFIFLFIIHYMWVEFVVGSLPCFEGFSSGSPVFLPPQKFISHWLLRASLVKQRPLFFYSFILSFIYSFFVLFIHSIISIFVH